MQRSSSGRLSNLPARFSSFYSQGGSACLRYYTPWGSILSDDECERKSLGSPIAEVRQENSEELNCSGCKRSQTVALKNPPTSPLPSERTEGTAPFNVIGVDFAGPVKYRSKRKEERKAYVVLYSCSLTRGVFLEILPSLETSDFIQSLKRFTARRGRPSKVYSGNGKTFVAAAKWLKRARSDERFNSFLSEHAIQWQFNLSRAPRYGGQFERLIGVMKSMFYKTVGQGLLTWEELSEVILDIR